MPKFYANYVIFTYSTTDCSRSKTRYVTQPVHRKNLARYNARNDSANRRNIDQDAGRNKNHKSDYGNKTKSQ